MVLPLLLTLAVSSASLRHQPHLTRPTITHDVSLFVPANQHHTTPHNTIIPIPRTSAPHQTTKHPTRPTPKRPRHKPVEANLGERFVRLVKSNVNSALSALEDPEKVLEQAVADMQRDLVKVRQSYAEVSASSKRMEEQRRLAEEEAAKWYSRAQLALEKQEEDLAREALTRRQQNLETAANLADQVESQAASLTTLFESMKELEAKMSEAKAKKDQIIARARTAKAATRVNDMVSGLGSDNSMAAFDRMTEKVEQLEAEAEVSRDMAGAPMLSGGSTESRFKALEGGESVQDELAKMKAALPASKVDDDLDELKRLMKEDE